MYHSTLGLGVIKKKKIRVKRSGFRDEELVLRDEGLGGPAPPRPIRHDFFFFFITLKPRVE